MSAAVGTQPAATVTQPTSEVPRKRKKRASAVGAAVDCFTCSSRNIKCDRRRPYCSQCLDAGQDCSGYKTQLTWGVGVASRGKLRGLSKPVAGTQKVAGSDSPPKSKRRRESHVSETPSIVGRNTSPVSPLTSPNTLLPPGPQNSVLQTSPITPSISTYNNQAWSAGAASATSTSPQTNASHDELRFHHVATNQATNSQPAYQSPPTYTQPTQYFPIPPTSIPVTSQPLQSPQLAYSGGTLDKLSTQYATQFGLDHLSPSDISTASSALPKTPAYYTPLQHDEVAWSDLRQVDNIPKSITQPAVNIATKNVEEEDVEEIERDLSNEYVVSETHIPAPSSFIDSLSGPMVAFSTTNGVGKTPRMRYLINYYAEVISPVIVAFDGPHNPFRWEVLRMALKSETLQHAISALSASNIRRRQESGGAISTGKTVTTRRSSMAHRTLTDEQYAGPIVLSLEEQIREETFHKRVAVQQLNRQLADRVLRHEDTILATLLVLCLFDMCDSGVANFQTQFAGVKKLLTVRGDELGMLNPEAKWMTRMFAWYDAFSATVNDREAQFSTYKTDPTAFSGAWSFSNLAGIDGQLFSTISKLGRLNSLVQGKAVTQGASTASRPLPPMPFMNGAVNQFDGNGWMRILEDEDLFSSKTQTYDLSTQFWNEWREVRQELQTWTMPIPVVQADGLEDQSLTPEQRIDLGNVSEAFRFAALLYTERIANPTIPSSDGRIQNWVRKSLHYIQLAKSDTYLLWAVFITGAECIDEAGRNIVRERARDIQKDSGFVNNASCLDILEKVWEAGESAFASANEVYDVQPQVETSRKSAFIFRDVMLGENVDGEYFVL